VHVLPGSDADEQRGVPVTVPQLRQLRVAPVAHLRQLPVRLGVVAHAQSDDQLATRIVQLLGRARGRTVTAVDAQCPAATALGGAYAHAPAPALGGALQGVDAAASARYPEVDVGDTDGGLRCAAGAERRQRDGPGARRRRGGVVAEKPTSAAARRRVEVVFGDVVEATARRHGRRQQFLRGARRHGRRVLSSVVV